LIDNDLVIAMIHKFGDPWAKELQDDLWLRWPTNAADPVLAAEQRREASARLGQLLPFLAVPIAFVAIAFTLFKISTTRRVPCQDSWPSEPHPTRPYRKGKTAGAFRQIG
jgi:hypothetical protein